ncbi:hypothetical protein [Neobacillus sp. 19]|uniref:hypothetical protein n=1 Tax=Neobacillus sp. 19 TaxID=3394458 RepID=UPI003BF765E6
MKSFIKWEYLIIVLLSVSLLSGCGFKDIDKRFLLSASVWILPKTARRNISSA